MGIRCPEQRHEVFHNEYEAKGQKRGWIFPYAINIFFRDLDTALSLNWHLKIIA